MKLRDRRNCRKIWLSTFSILGFFAPAYAADILPAEISHLAGKLPPPATKTVDFPKDILPLFDSRCIRCHGAERPKSGFRLTSREAALKGGNDGIDIVPGKSTDSPLLYYVARLIEDKEMPPPGKGEPFTREEVGLIRAWIDQGAAWDVVAKPTVVLSVTPSVQWFSVKGDVHKFREDTGIDEGFSGGAESIFYQEEFPKNRKLTFQGQIFGNPEEYKFKLQLDQTDLGYIQLGAEQHRKYFDDTGGFYPGIGSFDLNRDLYLDSGRAWIELGLVQPHLPRITFGYEYRYRTGTESILEWGDVGSIPLADDPFTLNGLKLYPATKTIDEKAQIVKFDISHEISGVALENQFQTEFYQESTERKTAGYFNSSTSTLDKFYQTGESNNSFQASDAISAQKQLRDWLFLSGGYYFSHFDGDYSIDTQPISPVGIYSAEDKFWRTPAIRLEQSTHVANANAQLGPWDQLILYTGVQAEWMSQSGFGDVQLDEGIPGDLRVLPASVDANLDRANVEEKFGARYTKIPWTVLFAEGRLAQESIGQFEQEIGGDHEFLRDTDASSELQEARFGFTISPWTRVSLTAQYKHQLKVSDYDHLRDEAFGGKNDGYSAFITGRELDNSEVSTKLSLRPFSWLKTTLSYQLFATDYTTATESYAFPGLTFTPGGPIYAGNYDAQVYSASIALTRWQRLLLSSTVSYRHSRTATYGDLDPVVVPYKGNLYSTFSRIGYTINRKTELNFGYNYSWADYTQDNFPGGLPLGLAYDWHQVSAGISRKISKRINGTLHYRFYSYNESNTDGVNNYIAHGILASMTISMD